MSSDKEVALSLMKTTRALEVVSTDLKETRRALHSALRRAAKLRSENDRLRAQVEAIASARVEVKVWTVEPRG